MFFTYTLKQIGYPPFFSENAADTCKKILSWKKNLVIPSDAKISKESIDIIKKLMTDLDKRLGYHGADEIKAHPFFRGIDWNNVKKMKPPFLPDVFYPLTYKLKHDLDTRYFDEFQDDEPFYPIKTLEDDEEPNPFAKDVCFIDFDYKRDFDQQNNLDLAMSLIDNVKTALKLEPRNISVKASNSRAETKSSDGIGNLNKQNSEDGSTDKKFSELMHQHQLTKKGTSDFLIKSKDIIEKMGIKENQLKEKTAVKPPGIKISKLYENNGKITQSQHDLKKPITPLDSAKSKPLLTLNSENRTKSNKQILSSGLTTSNSKSSKTNLLPPSGTAIPRTATHNNMKNKILKVYFTLTYIDYERF